jgi:hypothetical protein
VLLKQIANLVSVTMNADDERITQWAASHDRLCGRRGRVVVSIM